MNRQQRRAQVRADRKRDAYYAVIAAELSVRVQASNHNEARSLIAHGDQVEVVSLDGLEEIREGPLRSDEYEKCRSMVDAELSAPVGVCFESEIPQSGAADAIYQSVASAARSLNDCDLNGLLRALKIYSDERHPSGIQELISVVSAAVALRDAFWVFVANGYVNDPDGSMWREIERTLWNVTSSD